MLVLERAKILNAVDDLPWIAQKGWRQAWGQGSDRPSLGGLPVWEDRSRDALGQSAQATSVSIAASSEYEVLAANRGLDEAPRLSRSSRNRA
jgi:hypothetical protein